MRTVNKSVRVRMSAEQVKTARRLLRQAASLSGWLEEQQRLTRFYHHRALGRTELLGRLRAIMANPDFRYVRQMPASVIASVLEQASREGDRGATSSSSRRGLAFDVRSAPAEFRFDERGHWIEMPSLGKVDAEWRGVPADAPSRIVVQIAKDAKGKGGISAIFIIEQK